MKTKNLISAAAALLIFAVIMASCTSDSVNISVNGTAQEDTVTTGQELFRLNCAGCHGIDRKGNLPDFPALLTIKEKLSKEQIAGIIKHGGKLMPPVSHFSEEETNALIDYLFDKPDEPIVVKKISPAERGKNIAANNCLRCHRLTIHDSLPEGAKAGCRMMQPAAFAGVTGRFTKEKFYDILQQGPCYMPSFDFLNTVDKEDIWTYLKTVEDDSQSSSAMQEINDANQSKGK